MSAIVKSVEYDRLGSPNPNSNPNPNVVAKVDKSSSLEECGEKDVAICRNPTQLSFVPCRRKHLRNFTVVAIRDNTQRRNVIKM
jgi:hypothetical protein